MADDVFGIVGTVQGGSFRVDEAVAQGGFAVVYRAYHGAFRSSVALKCLKVPRTLTEAEQKEFLEKFREEAELLFRLSAGIPAVVRPLHVGTLTLKERLFVPFIALEWLDGQTLDEMITSRALAGEPPLDLRSVVKLLTPVADALFRAHSFETPAGGKVAIVHRDLKPENIFIAKVAGRDLTKILDFGIAKVKSAATQIAGRQSAHESAISAFTPAYGAPEQWFPKRYGQTGSWTDVWGLAITAVEALCGHAPIDGDPAAMMGAAIDPSRRPTPRNEGVKVTDEVEAAFARALAVDPRDRFHDVSEFWNVLCRAVGLPVIAQQLASLPPPPEVAAQVEPPVSAGARTVVQRDAGLEVPDLVVTSKPAPQSAPRAAASARKPGAAPAAPARPEPRNDPNAMFGSAFDAFDDDEPSRRIETATGFGSGLGHESLAPSRPRAVPAAARRRSSDRPGTKLALGGPLRLFALAVALMAGDWVYSTVTGEVLQVGPARMLWLAGPIAVLGAYQLVIRLLAAAD